jgi:sarcosine oxidase subunit alpha
MLDTLRLTVHPILGKSPAFRRTVRIMVNDCATEAVEGESLAAALWAKGIVVLRHDETTTSPRGMYCGVGHCFECRVTVDGVGDVRACITPVREGMRVTLPEGTVRRGEDGDH